jgi:Coenzyme PQQ synthesis protein D (PqqD)
MVQLHQQLRPHKEVVDTELEGQETVLLNLQNKLYYSLNPTGTRIWQGIKRGLTLQEISRGLQREFAVEPNRADRSVLSLVEDLCQQQLVQSIEE